MSNSDATLIIQEIHLIPETSPMFGLDVYSLAYSDSQNGDPDTADDCKKCQVTPAFFNNFSIAATRILSLGARCALKRASTRRGYVTNTHFAIA
jgi:hypothetical protein